MAVPDRPVTGQPVNAVWGQVVHDSAVIPEIQRGVYNAVNPAGNTDYAFSVTFPHAFSTVPIVVVSMSGSDNYAYRLIANAHTPTVNGFQLRLHSADNTGIGGINTLVSWIAIGNRV